LAAAYLQASTAKFWMVLAMFAAATPLGIAVGYATSTPPAQHNPDTVFDLSFLFL
jgi:hypothetical protein